MNTSTKKAEPGVVAEWTKGQDEVIYVSLQEHEGRTVVNIRVWYRGLSAKDGISLGLAKHATKIAKRALKEAEATITREDHHHE
ncbi:hypothetical protein HAP48_0004460 [Bradyrhizobium septentrionale]|uniref:Transcriptional coactivator p15 (PC4) C-terminal domain-containing protein n=1 Tax=Bradyrhizobium septentrionale TaxID=1404411 RepID=A0A974A4C6_9BRAD|nr:hypothetical protein [Bradyrhizobium septentrionale]UGY16795.1 hypothetical protein HAP48_0004460 [Bradyrhizobium septentrionale]